MIAYKVVEKNTRWCSNWAMIKICSELFELKYNIRRRNENKEYYPKYNNNSTIKAVKGSIGLLCFDTKENAERFAAYCGFKYVIIKVKGIGKPRKKFKIKIDCGCYIHALVNNSYSYFNYVDSPPKGSISFKKVKVLE